MLVRFIAVLDGCGVVPSKYLKFALSKDEHKALKQEIQRLKRPAPAYVKSSLKGYLLLLRRADQLAGRAEASSGRRVESTYVGLHPKRSLRDQAELAYERALEKLHEVLEENPGTRNWLDREVTFDQHSDLSLDPSGVPRLKTSMAKGVVDSVEKAKVAATLAALKDSLAAMSAEDC